MYNNHILNKIEKRLSKWREFFYSALRVTMAFLYRCGKASHVSYVADMCCTTWCTCVMPRDAHVFSISLDYNVFIYVFTIFDTNKGMG